jgi:hypothetical protein
MFKRRYIVLSVGNNLDKTYEKIRTYHLLAPESLNNHKINEIIPI